MIGQGKSSGVLLEYVKGFPCVESDRAIDTVKWRRNNHVIRLQSSCPISQDSKNQLGRQKQDLKDWNLRKIRKSE